VSRLRFAADETCVGDAIAWLEAQCTAHGLAHEIAACLAVVSEEIITNIVKYGGPPVPTVEFSIDYLPPAVQLTVIDDGVPFDPTAAEHPAPSDDLEQRGVGGLGLLLIREMMDEVAYARASGCNHLTLRKRI
jgi:serine/threonine-protein kinase RsbW